MTTWRLLLSLPVAACLVAQAPAKAGLGLTPAEVDGVLQDLGGVVPFLKKDFSTAKVFAAFHAKGAYEDAKPLLPAEFLALPEDQRAKALHPDTTVLLVLQLARAAAWARPEEAASKDWMVPVLIKAQQLGNPSAHGLRGTSMAMGGNEVIMGAKVGRIQGPCWPLLEFRRNLPDPDPRVGLDVTTRMTEPDRPSRSFGIQHSGGFTTYAPELSFATDDKTKAELEHWVLARILVARAEGAWDPPALRSQFLRLAAPRVPGWDVELAARFKRATEALQPAPPAR